MKLIVSFCDLFLRTRLTINIADLNKSCTAVSSLMTWGRRYIIWISVIILITVMCYALCIIRPNRFQEVFKRSITIAISNVTLRLCFSNCVSRAVTRCVVRNLTTHYAIRWLNIYINPNSSVNCMCQWYTEGGLGRGGFNFPPPPNSEGPPKSSQTQPIFEKF